MHFILRFLCFYMRGFYYNRDVKPMYIYLIIYILYSHIFYIVCFPLKKIFLFPFIFFFYFCLFYSPVIWKISSLFLLYWCLPFMSSLFLLSLVFFFLNKLECRVIYSILSCNRYLLRDIHVLCTAVLLIMFLLLWRYSLMRGEIINRQTGEWSERYFLCI